MLFASRYEYMWFAGPISVPGCDMNYGQSLDRRVLSIATASKSVVVMIGEAVSQPWQVEQSQSEFIDKC